MAVNVASDMSKVLKKLSDESILKQSELAELLGYSSQDMNALLTGRKSKDMTAGKAIQVADALGYQLVLVPKGKKLPEGSEVISVVDY